MFSESALLAHLASKFELQVVILYGSAATGNHKPTSDIDVVCFVKHAESYPTSYVWNGMLLDLWIHPLKDAEFTENFIKLHSGRVLLDTDGIGRDLLERVTARLAQPRARLHPARECHLRRWAWKMFDRALGSDIEGNHRRHWLLQDLPEIWCDLRQHHFLGAPDAFRRMRVDEPGTYHLLELAMQPAASASTIEQAVVAIIGERPIDVEAL